MPKKKKKKTTVMDLERTLRTMADTFVAGATTRSSGKAINKVVKKAKARRKKKK